MLRRVASCLSASLNTVLRARDVLVRALALLVTPLDVLAFGLREVGALLLDVVGVLLVLFLLLLLRDEKIGLVLGLDHRLNFFALERRR